MEKEAVNESEVREVRSERRRGGRQGGEAPDGAVEASQSEAGMRGYGDGGDVRMGD